MGCTLLDKTGDRAQRWAEIRQAIVEAQDGGDWEQAEQEVKRLREELTTLEKSMTPAERIEAQAIFDRRFREYLEAD